MYAVFHTTHCHSERVRLRPCLSERSRGISWKRTVWLFLFFSPATRFSGCLSFAPRGLSGAANKQRFREMFRQAQHDRKLFSFVPLIDLYVSFLFVMATIGRQFSVEAPNTARALRSERFPLRHSERGRLRPCHSERSRGISWKRTVRLDYCSAVILNAVFLLPRDKILLFFKYSPARVKFMP